MLGRSGSWSWPQHRRGRSHHGRTPLTRRSQPSATASDPERLDARVSAVRWGSRQIVGPGRSRVCVKVVRAVGLEITYERAGAGPPLYSCTAPRSGRPDRALDAANEVKDQHDQQDDHEDPDQPVARTSDCKRHLFRPLVGMKHSQPIARQPNGRTQVRASTRSPCLAGAHDRGGYGATRWPSRRRPETSGSRRGPAGSSPFRPPPARMRVAEQVDDLLDPAPESSAPRAGRRRRSAGRRSCCRPSRRGGRAPRDGRRRARVQRPQPSSGHSRRRRISRSIQFSSESGSRRCAATLTRSGAQPSRVDDRPAERVRRRRRREAAVAFGRPLHRRAHAVAPWDVEVLAPCRSPRRRTAPACPGSENARL